MAEQNHEEVFDRMEDLFLRTRARLTERMNFLQQPEQNEQLEDEFDENDVMDGQQSPNRQNEQENQLEDDRNSVHELSSEINRTPSIRSERAMNMVPPMYQPITPIFVQCHGSRSSGKIENTWGEFDGTLSKWRGFRDRFVAVVHNDERIAPAIKFQSLWHSLTGKALTDLGDWSCGNEEYDELWERLKELYDRKYHTSGEILRKFTSLKKLEKATEPAIQKLSNVTNEVIRQLRAFDYPVDNMNIFFVHELHARLDFHTARAWEMHRESETPTIKEMLAFLDKQAEALMNSHVQEQKPFHENRKRQWQGKPNHFNKSMKPNITLKNGAIATSIKTEHLASKVCEKGSHPVFRCEKFRAMNLNDRKKNATEKKLCYNCLSPSHTIRECESSNCKRCDKKHNSLLCGENPLNQAVNTVQVSKGAKKANKKAKKKNESQTEPNSS